MKSDVAKLRNFIKQFAPISEKYGRKAVLADLEHTLETVCQKTHVLFCGEFKRGKSSLINAILNDNLCPTDIGIATSVVTRIMYGETKKAIRYYGNILSDSENMKKEEIAWEDISRYTVGDLIDIDYTVQMDVYYPSDFLKDGIIIIDTPGIGGLDPRHGVLTKSALQSADIAVFITDANEPVTQSERDFYFNHVLTNCKNNLVLINKVDVLIPDELHMHVETTRKILVEENKAEVVPVSAMNWLLYNQLEAEEFQKNSYKNDVLNAIEKIVCCFRKEQLVKLRDILINEICAVINSVSEEKKILQADSKSQDRTIENYQKQMGELASFRNDISNPTSPIRLKVNTIFENVRNEVLGMLSHESTLLTTTTFDRLIDSEKGLSNDGKWLVAQINDQIQDLVKKINGQTKDAFEKIAKTLQREMPKTFISSTSPISGDLKTHTVFNSQLAFSVTSKLSQGGIIAFATAAGVEWLMPATITTLIPGVGWLVGLAAAGTLIWRRMSQENSQQKKTMIRQQLLPNINLALTDLRNQTNSQFSKFQQGILETLHVMIKEAENGLKTMQDSISQSRAGKKELVEMLSTVEQRDKYLNTLLAQCKLLYTNPFAKNG